MALKNMAQNLKNLENLSIFHCVLPSNVRLATVQTGRELISAAELAARDFKTSKIIASFD